MLYLKRINLLLICCLGLLNISVAQDYTSKIIKLGSEDGLNGLIKFQMHYDQLGFLWMLSQYGLDRYDGQEILNVNGLDKYKEGHSIVQLHESKDSLLWLVFGEGIKVGQGRSILDQNEVLLINIITSSVVEFENAFKGGIPFQIKNITSFYSAKGTIYLQLKNGDLYQYDGMFEKIGAFSPELLINRKWVITPEKFIVKIQEDTISKFNLSGQLVKSTVLPKKHGYSLVVDETGNFQVSIYRPDQYLAYLVSKDLVVLDSIQPHRLGTPFLKKRLDGNFLSIDNGIAQIVDENKRELVNVPAILDLTKDEFNIQAELPYQPDAANFFCLQTGEGPLIIYNYLSPFENEMVGEKYPNSMRGITTTAEGFIYAESRGEIFKIDPKLHSTTRINKFDGQFQNAYLHNHYDPLSNVIYISFVSCITKYDTKTQELEVFTRSSSAYNSEVYHIFTVGKEKKVLAASQKGLSEFDSNCNCLKQYVIDSPSHPINQKKIEQLKTINGKNYVFTAEQVFLWDFEKNICNLISEIPIQLRGHNFAQILLLKENEFWISTTGNGLVNWNIVNGNIQYFTKEHGLGSDVVYATFLGDDGRLWMSTANGISDLDLESHSVRTFTTADGIPHPEFNRRSYHQDNTGKIYFGGLNGLTAFYPKAVNKLPNKDLPTYFVEIKVSSPQDSTSRILEYKSDETIKIKSNEILHITFSAPNVLNDQPLAYQYKFESPNAEWTKHNGSSLVWSSQEAVLNIVVPTPFFQSKWFYLNLLLILAVIGYVYARWRIFNLENARKKLTAEVDRRTLSIQKSKTLIQNQAAELKQLDALKSDFFTNISHELRTPLTLIRNPLIELQKKKDSNEDQNDYLKTAFGATQQLESIIERILKLSEFNTESIVLQEEEVSIQRICDFISSSYESQANANELSLQIKTSITNENKLLIDVKKLQEVIHNIVTNAIKFTPAGGQINIDLNYNNGKFIFLCEDNGIGIPVADRTKIFSNYFQSKQSNSPAQGGLGIGLPLSKEYARLMNGTLTLEPPMDKGSIFKLQIPVKLLESSANTTINTVSHIEEAPSKEIEIFDSKKPTLLIVEDHNMMNLLLTNILRSSYNIISAQNGKIGLQKIKIFGDRIDLIITDWMMPIMDGPTFLNEIRKESKWNIVPSIMLTARATQADRISIFKIGVDDYILKPFDPEELKTRINNLLENSRIRKEDQEAKKTKASPEFESGPSIDEKWISKLEDHTLKGIKTPNFSVAVLAEKMNLSERQLGRRLKNITGLTSGNFIKEYRLLRARHLLENKQMKTMAEVCYAVGFTTPDYFSKIYFKRFGKLPSSYLR